MALFTDSGILGLDDLLQFESGLVQVSSTHGIDIDTKIKLATDEIGAKVLLFLLRAGPSDRWSSRAKLGLTNVVVSPAMFKWICNDTLAKIYAEAYNVQLNTRFQGKWNEYQKQADAASEIVFASGIGVVFDPLARPLIPSLKVRQGSLPVQSLFVQASWTDILGQESAPSPINGMNLTGFASLDVSMSEQLTNSPRNAIGWSVYASNNQQGLTRQNLDPIPLGTSWTLPASGLILGLSSPGGQSPSYFVPANRRWLRG